jgi:hypothetical protein
MSGLRVNVRQKNLSTIHQLDRLEWGCSITGEQDVHSPTRQKFGHYRPTKFGLTSLLRNRGLTFYTLPHIQKKPCKRMDEPLLYRKPLHRSKMNHKKRQE